MKVILHFKDSFGKDKPVETKIQKEGRDIIYVKDNNWNIDYKCYKKTGEVKDNYNNKLKLWFEIEEEK